MKEEGEKRCGFCGVPFPQVKTPYIPILVQGREEKKIEFCCLGCAKGHQKVSEALSSAQNQVESEKKKPLPPAHLTREGSVKISSPELECFRFLAEMAIRYGASRAAVILATDVFVDPRAKYKCYIPICRKLGSNLSCPPFSPSAEETLRLKDSYKQALLIQCEGDPAEFTYEATLSGIQLQYYMRVNNIVSAIESIAQKAGYYLAIGFGAGHCKLCGHGIDPEIKCAGIVDGKPLWNRCRYPLRARPSMESVGIDVLRTARKAGLPAAFHGITSPVQEVHTASTFGIVLID